ncbi:DUF2797 domain-containing protein [Halovivax sp.]|uniref:DUF2797 domain-containing protein n=1 Tax=Halovivax sp. TaxID=1935978 RepID=UPI0025BFE974|nr:DUF2797 domain-containing protein [Halovivax sp.]
MQVVGYEPTGRGAALLVVDDDGRLTRQPLQPGTELAYALGERRCAGRIDRAADRHESCDRLAAPYCEEHASTWICARCTGTCLKDEMDCYDEHAVYIAAFAPTTFKVGVTRLERLETRFREQGADRGAHVHTVSNGRIARELEAEYADALPDRVGTPSKVAGLAATVEDAAWESVLADFDVIDRFAFDYGLDLSSRPVAETIATGTVVGCKGRLLVIARGGTRYAVDMRDLVGYEVAVGGTDRHLQSSLGSFGSP